MLLVINSKKETDIGVAYGFPTETLHNDEMYVSDSITNYLMPTDNKLTVKIEASMVSSGMSMVSDVNMDDKLNAHLIANVIDYAFSSGLKFDKDYEKILISLLGITDPDLKTYYQNNKMKVAVQIQQMILNDYSEGNPDLDETDPINDLKFEHEYLIKEIIHNPRNKWPIYFGNIILIDYTSFQKVIKRQLFKFMTSLSYLLDFSEIEDKIYDGVDQISHFGMQANILFKNRRELFYEQNLPMMRFMLEKYAIELTQNYSMTSPTIENYNSLVFLTDMQDASFVCIILILSFVSGVVVYSLMLFDIDERRYEMGMLRALGMSKNSIVILMLNQSFFFAIPGLIIGLIFA